MSRKLVDCTRYVSLQALEREGVRNTLGYLQREVQLASEEVLAKAETLHPKEPIRLVADIKVSVYTYVEAPEATVSDA